MKRAASPSWACARSKRSTREENVQRMENELLSIPALEGNHSLGPWNLGSHCATNELDDDDDEYVEEDDDDEEEDEEEDDDEEEEEEDGEDPELDQEYRSNRERTELLRRSLDHPSLGPFRDRDVISNNAEAEEWNIARRTRARLSLQDKSVEELGANEEMLNNLLLQEIWDDAEEDENVNLYKQFLLNGDIDENDDDDEEYRPRGWALEPTRGTGINNAFRQNTSQGATRERRTLSASTSNMARNSGEFPNEERIAARTRAHVSYADKRLEDLEADESTLNALMTDLPDDSEEAEGRRIYQEFLRDTIQVPTAAPLPPSSVPSPLSPQENGLIQHPNSVVLHKEFMKNFPTPSQKSDNDDAVSSEKSKKSAQREAQTPCLKNLITKTLGSRQPNEQFKRLYQLLQKFVALSARQHAFAGESELNEVSVTTSSSVPSHVLRQNAMELLQEVAKRGREAQENRVSAIPSIFTARGVERVEEYCNGTQEKQLDMIQTGFGAKFKRYWSPSSAASDANLRGKVVTLGRNGRRRFTQAEDILLLQGLRKFLESRYDKIYEYYFIGSNLNAQQLRNRFRNMGHQKTEQRPELLQQLDEITEKGKKDRYFPPLTKAECQRMSQGLAKFGNCFDQISNQFLPHRYPDILKEFFEAELANTDFRKKTLGSTVQSFTWEKAMDRDLLVSAMPLKEKRDRWQQVHDSLVQRDPSYVSIPVNQVALRYAILMVAHRFQVISETR